MNDFELARADFQKVLQLYPNNKAAKTQLAVCQQRIRRQLAREKKLYANMFERLAEEENKVRIGVGNSWNSIPPLNLATVGSLCLWLSVPIPETRSCLFPGALRSTCSCCWGQCSVISAGNLPTSPRSWVGYPECNSRFMFSCGPGAVAHTCNPGTLQGQSGRIT